MERIRGQTIAERWLTLSNMSKASIFNQLKQMIEELQSIPSKSSVVSNLQGGPIYDCRLPQTSLWGPFKSVYDFQLALRNGITAHSLEAQTHSSPGPAAIPELQDLIAFHDSESWNAIRSWSSGIAAGPGELWVCASREWAVIPFLSANWKS